MPRRRGLSYWPWRPARRLSAAAPGAGRSSRDACPAWRVASAARSAHHARASALCSHPRASISAPACPCRHSSVVGGTRPSQAESCRPERNCAPSPIVATSAVAVMTPTPGIVARRRLALPVKLRDLQSRTGNHGELQILFIRKRSARESILRPRVT